MLFSVHQYLLQCFSDGFHDGFQGFQDEGCRLCFDHFDASSIGVFGKHGRSTKVAHHLAVVDSVFRVELTRQLVGVCVDGGVVSIGGPRLGVFPGLNCEIGLGLVVARHGFVVSIANELLSEIFARRRPVLGVVKAFVEVVEFRPLIVARVVGVSGLDVGARFGGSVEGGVCAVVNGAARIDGWGDIWFGFSP